MTSSSSPRCRAGRMRSCALSSRAAVRSGPDRDWYCTSQTCVRTIVRVIHIFRVYYAASRPRAARCGMFSCRQIFFSHAKQCKLFREVRHLAYVAF
eukprot:scaffold72554_cov66-Phaeocystis_antarctica.AAC.3